MRQFLHTKVEVKFNKFMPKSAIWPDKKNSNAVFCSLNEYKFESNAKKITEYALPSGINLIN